MSVGADYPFLTRTEMENEDCEFCGASDAYISRDLAHWICRDCDDDDDNENDDLDNDF